MRYPLIHFAVLFGIAPLALGGCAQMTGGNLQRQVDANEQAIRQINSQLSGVQPAQADTWSQVQALRQEVAALRGDMDTSCVRCRPWAARRTWQPPLTPGTSRPCV